MFDIRNTKFAVLVPANFCILYSLKLASCRWNIGEFYIFSCFMSNKTEIQPVNVQVYCSKYKWQLYVSATTHTPSGCMYQKYKRKYYACSILIVTKD
jgi:hypothetical protein